MSLLALLAGCGAESRQAGTDPALVVDAALAENRARGDTPDAGAVAPARTDIGVGGREAAVRGFIRRGVEGTGLPTPRGTLRDDRPGDITLDFAGADLQSVVQVMLEEGLGANYLIDPEVSGMVTLRTNRPLRREEILPTLEEILRLNDAAILDRGGVFSIVPLNEAGQSAPLLTFRDVAARGLTVRVTPLRFVDVEDIQNVLDSFAPVAGAIRYDTRSNLVFTIGTTAEQATLIDVIATLDRDYLAGRSFALVPLDSGDPTALVEEMDLFFTRPDGRPSTDVRFVGIERMNAVLIVADEGVLLDQALDLVRVLDQDAGERPRLHIFNVQARRATELANLLGEIFNAEVGELPTRDIRRGPELAPGFTTREDRTSGLTSPPLGATDTDIDGGLVDGLGDQQTGFADAPPPILGADLAAPAAVDTGGGPGAIGGAGVFRVIADETSNTVIALATNDGAAAISSALERLDVRPLQVMIEATLVEVQLNDELEFGVRWFLQEGNFNFDFGDALGTGAASILPGFNAAFQTGDVTVTLSALDSVTDVRLLSAPTLMVLDNQIARLQVGDQVPVTVRASASTTDVDAPIVEETEFRDTGVILEIQPTVNANGTVTLNIRQEVSDVSDTSPVEGNPTFAQRVVDSTISIQSGETVALAGLIEEDGAFLRDGIPILSRAPVIGPLFGVTSDAFDRTELLVLIRPIVIRDQSEARAATEELRQKLIGLVPRSEDLSLRREPRLLSADPDPE